MKIRGQLAWTILAALVPVLIAAAVGATLLLQNERHAFERDAVGRTRSAMSAVDAEVRSSIDTLRAIASSRQLVHGNVADFHDDARRALASHPSWFNIGLATAEGNAVFDARSPVGSPAPRVLEDAFVKAVNTGEPVVGDIGRRMSINQPAVRIQLPVKIDGQVRYVMTADLDPATFTRILQAQQLPPDWIIALVDRNHRFIARIPTLPVGNPISQTFREGLEKAPEGFIEGRTTEGYATYTPYVTSTLTGWALGIAIPRATVNAGSWSLLPPLLLGIVLATALAVGIGRFMGRQVAEPVAALAAGATAIRRGDTRLPPVRSEIDEIAELDRGLREAAVAVQKREAEARSAQDALRRSEQKYRTLVANLPGTAVFVVDRELRYTMAEGEAIVTAGFQPDDFLGKTLHEVLPAALAAEYEAMYRRALDGQTFAVEHSAFGRHYVTRGAPVKDDYGKVEAALAVSHDVTDRRLATDLILRQRGELQTMLDLMPVGVAIAHDARADDISITAHFAEILGVEQGGNESLTGSQPDRVRYRYLRDGTPIPPEELPMQRAARGGVEVRDEELDVERADGSIVNLIASAAPLFDTDGNVRGAIGAHVNVTALKNVQRELEAADRRKDEFLATLAHELRNPMAPIRYAAELLRSDVSADAVHKARQTIERQSAMMARLLDDLLDMSRITRNAIELQFERVDLRRIAQEAVDIARPSIESARHQLGMSLPDTPLWVKGDATRLLQVFGNLLNNAAKFSERGGRVDIELSEQDGFAVALVRDTGIGLAPGMLTAVFDLFSQVHKEQRIQSGLGIGLSVVKRLVEMHGGSIRATSEGIGRGSTFLFSLPLAIGLRGVEPASISANAIGTAVPATGTRVLVVDDNADTAESLELVLNAYGLDAAVAHGGRAALARAAEFRPQVIVLDLGLPDIGGEQVAERIRAQPWGGEIHLIAVTGWGQVEDRARTAAAGFDVHLVKPVNPVELIQIISQRLMRSAA